jgi:hypothetical protein
MTNSLRICPLWLAVLCALFTSCAPQSAPPYVITQPVCVAGERPGFYRYAGIELYISNTSDIAISELTVSFALFDAETGKNPFAGSNKFSLTLRGTVMPYDKKELIIPLDDYLYLAPRRPFIIDFFYIAKIEYADGSVWTDNHGIYHTGSQL